MNEDLSNLGSPSVKLAKPNLILAVFAGVAAALIGAIAWAVVTVTSKYQIGWMAIGVGLLVGFAVSFGNGGKAFQILGAFLALFGCVLGNFFSLIAFASVEQQIGLFATFANVDYMKAAAVMWDDFLSIDILFYALAIYEGYRFSIGRSRKSESLPKNTAS